MMLAVVVVMVVAMLLMGVILLKVSRWLGDGGERYEQTFVYDMRILYRNKSTLNNIICTTSRNISLYDYTMLRMDWG